MSILDRIIEQKRREVASQRADQPFERVKQVALERGAPRGFAEALRRSSPAVIAEIKRGSPSRGDIRRNLEPVSAAHEFADNGAAAISILTDSEFFLGSLAFVPVVREQLSKHGKEIPILRKDFLIDPYQIWQSRAMGSDAVLLIMACLDDAQFAELLKHTIEAELDVLVEVHDETEVERAFKLLAEGYGRASIAASHPMLGINNRNLANFTTDLSVTERLGSQCRALQLEAPPPLREMLLVSESGISTPADIMELSGYGADAFLVGESLVAEGSPGKNLAALLAG